MSLVTAFPFQAFQCDMNRAMHAVKLGVSLSLMPSADAEKMGFVKVSVPCGFELAAAPFRPVPYRGQQECATFYDTRMGNFDVRGYQSMPCTTCTDTQQSINKRCQGHFGYIEMPTIGDSGKRLDMYNPMVFSDLATLMQAQCFFCHKFRIHEYELTRYECCLKLIDAGQVGEGLHLLDVFPSKKKGPTTTGSAKRVRDPDAAGKWDESGPSPLMCNPDAIRQYTAERMPTTAVNPQSALCTGDVRNEIVSKMLGDMRSASSECCHCRGFSPKMTQKNSQMWLKIDKTMEKKNLHLKTLSEDTVRNWESEMTYHNRKRVLFRADEVKRHMVKICKQNADLLGLLFPSFGSPTVAVPDAEKLPPEKFYQVFFLSRVLVPPLPLRLQSGVEVSSSGISPDERTRDLSDILKLVHEIEAYWQLLQKEKATTRHIQSNESNLINLQQKIDKISTEVLDSFAKKQGLFRQNMMGKRVNQACRSVISPDHTVESNEVLLPRPFAKSLSFPDPLTFHSKGKVEQLRKCIENGPHVYPGATHIEHRQPSGSITVVNLFGNTERARKEAASKYIGLARGGAQIVVYRHVCDGDRLIFNRQPTLHKVSMMGYKAKVVSGLKTLRFHYVNGKSFNADFDGDEMNVHVPQSIECRVELDCIMDADRQYLVPTSGKPMRGLIQDHIAAGVLMTARSRFFEYEEFTQLMYTALQKYLRNDIDMRKLIPPPALYKPKLLWTGKQLMSVLVKFVTGVHKGTPGVSVAGHTQTPADAWSRVGRTPKGFDAMNEDTVIFQQSELLSGVMDKAQLGPTNLSVCHVIHELYGHEAVGMFFGAVGRLLTAFLRTNGFSIGVDDMSLLDPFGRTKALHEIDMCALDAPSEAHAVIAINKRASDLNKEFIPTKLLLPFPINQLTMMTISGAKGSNVNATQMALVLGQQFFDGQRIGKMSSQKTLPAFFQNDKRARAHGFAMGSFMSGIRPPEYTIHAMAGREGLIDTAIKTSRSGHLQRCLIKGMESITSQWDGTVRDSNGSVLQFRYGGDGLEACKSSTISAWNMVSRNLEAFFNKYDIDPSKEYPELPPQVAASLANGKLHEVFNPNDIARCLKKGKPLEERKAQLRKALLGHLETITANRLPRSIVDAGEPVGLLAAQAAGEPSTQMTLNTFHQAGATVSHVTEGIPRLRELFIFAHVSSAAVVIPVTNVGPAETKAIADLTALVTPILLKDMFAPLNQPMQWATRRNANCAVFSVTMLMSEPELKKAAKKMGMDQRKHVESFRQALMSLARKACNSIRGVRQTAASSGTVHQPDTSMGEDDVLEKDVDSDEESLIPEDAEPKSAVKNPEVDEESEASSSESEQSDGLLDDAESVDAMPASTAATYRTFSVSRGKVASGTIHYEVSPEEFPADRKGPYFLIRMTITTPTNLVAVYSDVLDACLKEVAFPTKTPQVETARFNPDQNDPTKGDIIFQGKGAKLGSLVRVASVFAEDAPGIQIGRAVSTDIHDMADAFGIEAAYALLHQELGKLFARYAVDPHHLSMIADAATHRGKWEAFNFNGIINRSSSPLFQMTFASSKRYLHTALARGIPDQLTSLSAAIMVGERPRVGTATVQVNSIDIPDIKERSGDQSFALTYASTP